MSSVIYNCVQSSAFDAGPVMWEKLKNIDFDQKRNKAYHFFSSRTHNWRHPTAVTVKCVTKSLVAPKATDQALQN